MEAHNDVPEIEREKIKLIKNTKGYNWELTIYPFPTTTGESTKLDETDLDRLERLNNVLNLKFGSMTE